MGCESSQAISEVQPHLIDSGPYVPPKPSLKIINSMEFTSDEGRADELFRQGRHIQAIAAYQKIIEDGYKIDFDIEGLGNFDHSTYRYEWWVYIWYDEERKAGRIKGNAYDALSLCYSQIMESNPQELNKGLMWYQDMLSEKYGYELYVGYANMYYNLYRYDDALKAYQKVLTMKPNFINAMVSIMFLHEFKRVEKPKSIAMAKKILELDPENMYACFVLGKNETNVDEKIKKLSAYAQRFPRYVRLINEVGLSYGAKKDHEMAIKYYKRCLDIAPQYAQGYNNVGFRTEMLGDKEEAIKWYYRAVEKDPKYKQALANAIKVFEDLGWSDDDIMAQIKKYPKMDVYNFYFYLGLAYYDKPRYQVALTWYKRALALNRTFNVLNSMGLTYDSTAQYKESEECYMQAIQLNPKYKFPYYNLGLMFKHQEKVELAIQWYKKAIENDPTYHPPYNNLANILRDQGKLKEAIELYKRCVEIHSTYTLVYCNMAICYLKQEMYQDAFNAFARAKELLPTDNNGLSEGNKSFLRENLEKFDKQGQKWRKTGSIGVQQKQQLKALIKSFQSNFKTLYSSEVSFQRPSEEVLRPGLLQVVKAIHEDQFSLKNIERIFQLIKHIFHDDEQYFHIIPQLFIQYFWNNTINQNRPILTVEEELNAMIKNISSKESSLGAAAAVSTLSLDIKMKNFNPPNDFKVNLFKDTAFFNSYEILYSEIVKVNKLAEVSLKEYIEFVEAVRKRANGIPYGVNMKLPKRQDQQFKVILRILEKMFKKEIDAERVKKIITKIDANLKAGGNQVTLINIVHEIMEVWTKEITSILQERSKDQVETTCAISDLLRGKVMFRTVDDIAKAIDACDKLCYLRGYQILELDNRLSKPQTMDVVLKIKVNDAVCELQLAMKQDESKYHLIHSIYEIERSPLGCIFGSYLFMSKGFNYPILANCKDIQQRLKDSANEQDKKTLQAAQYIISSLQQKDKK